jgi:hypothetical protein
MLLCKPLTKERFYMEQSKKRGRPLLNDSPMTAAQRKQRQREKMSAAGVKTINVRLSAYTAEMVKRYSEISGVPETVHIATIAEVAIADWVKDAEHRWLEIIGTIEGLNKNKTQTEGEKK